MSTVTSFSLFLSSLIYVTLSVNKPNIFFILADDLGWGDVGFHNTENPEVKTPNLDSLVKEGLELTRHYVHYVCCPTRSSFQSGRLPVHVTISGCTAPSVDAGIPQNMTTIAHKMKQANYSTHMIGKYHIGMATPTHTPKGRGFDTSLIYWTAEVEYFYQTDVCQNISVVDLWKDNQPAYNLNGTNYVDLLFRDEIYDLIENNFTENEPFFMVWTPHIAHAPLQIPKNYLTNYNNDESECSKSTTPGEAYPYIYPGMPNNTVWHCRSIVESMVQLLDELIGNVTNKLKQKGLWNNTLLVFSSDNGGPIGVNGNAANNYPLRGGKHRVWEGGIRAAAFVSGGYLPENRRGLKQNAMIHISDWYTTFSEMLGIDPFDENAAKHGLPPVEGYNVWPLILGINNTSPRTQIVIDSTTLIEGDYKLIVAPSVPEAVWQGPIYPNASSPKIPEAKANCKKGCLFDVVNDMTEHIDLASKNQQKVQNMIDTLNKLKKGFYNNSDDLKKDESCPKNIGGMQCACWMAVNKYHGYYGPFVNVDINTTQF